MPLGPGAATGVLSIEMVTSDLVAGAAIYGVGGLMAAYGVLGNHLIRGNFRVRNKKTTVEQKMKFGSPSQVSGDGMWVTAVAAPFGVFWWRNKNCKKRLRRSKLLAIEDWR